MFWQKTSIIVGGPLLVLSLLTMGLYGDLFHRTLYYDVFMHSLTGGLFVTTLAGIAWHLWLKKRPDGKFGLALKVAILALLLVAAIIWEIAEVIFYMTPNWYTSVSDTVSDVVYALVGGVFTLCVIRTGK